MNIINFLITLKIILISVNLIFSEEINKTENIEQQLRNAERIEKKIKELFEVIDENKNNTIEKDELLNHTISALKHLHKKTAEDEFERVDSNKNKMVTIDEYFIYGFENSKSIMDAKANTDNSEDSLKLRKNHLRLKETFIAADTDNDTFLNIKEYRHFKYPMFFPHMAHVVISDYIEFIDVDGDGFLNKKEYVNFFKKFVPSDEIENKKAIKDAAKDFRKYDKDGNRKIDAREYIEILKPGYFESANVEVRYLFEDTDADKDGLLSLEEVQKHSSRWLKGILIFEEDDEFKKEETYGHLGDEL